MGSTSVRNKILQITRQTIPYVRELRHVAKSVTGCLLMQQLDFHFAKYPDGFYKFLEPCRNSKFYKRGQSWQEELGFSAEEFRTAFDKIGVRYPSKSAFDAAADKFGGKYYCSYFDKQQGLTYYFRNHPVVDSALDRLIEGDDPPPAAEVDEESGEVDDPRSAVDRQPRSTVNRESRSTVDGQPRSPVDGDPDPCKPATPVSRDWQSRSPGIGVVDPPSLLGKENNKENTHRHRGGNSASGPGVCVASEFSLELCLGFAEHLHRTGHGITNPGGYAVSIYRSGVADMLIEKYLLEKEQPHNADRSAAYEARLTPDEIAERAALIRELIDGGYTPERVEAQFAGGFHAEDWELIKDGVVPAQRGGATTREFTPPVTENVRGGGTRLDANEEAGGRRDVPAGVPWLLQRGEGGGGGQGGAPLSGRPGREAAATESRDSRRVCRHPSVRGRRERSARRTPANREE